MKRISMLLSCVLALAGCSTLTNLRAWMQPQETRVAAPAKPAPQFASDGTPLVALDGVPIEKVEFKAGVSSVTVERMAKQSGCSGGVGAGLVTEAGPVEVYRMRCEDGRVFMARCELRQCTQMK